VDFEQDGNAIADVKHELKADDKKFLPETKSKKLSAEYELRAHELLALSACFLCPCAATWFLHAIRGYLMTPSEGLVSNYNLSIFLLVAEMRPLSHLWKLIQRRTFHLQKLVSAETLRNQSLDGGAQIMELTRRIDDLEGHVAGKAVTVENSPSNNFDATAAKATSQATSDLKKIFQPELDALNRAMRRYEKRTTISAIQIEARLQDLEARVKDAVVLAAAAQRTADSQPRRYTITLTNWMSSLVVVPVEYGVYLLKLPLRLCKGVFSQLERVVFRRGKQQSSRDDRVPRRGTTPRPRDRDRKAKVDG